MSERDIPFYKDYLSAELLSSLLEQSKPVAGVPELRDVGPGGGLESTAALQFLCELYHLTQDRLQKVLRQRTADRQFIDQRTRALHGLNRSLQIDFLDPDYATVIGQEDGQGRTVMGPLNDFYCRSGGGKSIAPLPLYLQGPHVTLFGPPDSAKLCINAMNAFHRKMKNEPALVAEILKETKIIPKWGADDEDSKTPLRADLISAGENLTRCFESNLSFTDSESGKTYELAQERLSLPIKRFPGLALPCLFLFYKKNPIPLHLYDFALHLFKNWHQAEALSFYVPKLENEEEAQYIHWMVETAEKLIHRLHPEYKLGTVRLFVVLENPRAVFRVHEMMDALHPYFAGASLGWHDYLASTARIFKEDSNYRLPVKADPHIVIKYIKASHDLLAEVVGSRGGVKIGGMYGVLPMDNVLACPSFQVAIKGFVKDVVTQLKRNLSGFWVAHPDFVRVALALVEAWKDQPLLESLVRSLLLPQHHQEILDFIRGPDLIGLETHHPLYPRSLIVADLQESQFIANNHPDEIRYNVFQSLQYLTDWLCGNGCVALPAEIGKVPVRVMDDLATAERSRWEVWHELYHGRFAVEEFLKICFEEMTFIRKNLSNQKKIVQVQWDARTAKWYPIAFRLMIQLMTDKKPAEFVTELLLPFTVESIRQSPDPWRTLLEMDGAKYELDPAIERFQFYFSICGNVDFAKAMAASLSLDLKVAEEIIKNFTWTQIQEAAFFHGDIGESKGTLDEMAAHEQALVTAETEELKKFGDQYRRKFGVKFLISAQGKSGSEILTHLKRRLNNSSTQELENARIALWEISQKRLTAQARNSLEQKIEGLRLQHKVGDAMVSLSVDGGAPQTLAFGDQTSKKTWFQLASLSKPIASCFALEYFRQKKISLQTSVNSLFEKSSSSFRIKEGDEVTLEHLLTHEALNRHYVDGVALSATFPDLQSYLTPIEVIKPPGKCFHYSGGGFLVLEHLIESLENKSVQDLTTPFLTQLGLEDLSFEQRDLPGKKYAEATDIPGGRKMFPAFAAGAMGTATDMSRFLQQLTQAFHRLEGCGPISHETAVRMLFGTDKGSVDFMGAKMGLGIFIAEAGANRLLLHQGANDGFRCLFVHCFDGPDLQKGFTILCTGDLNGVLFISETAQLLLQEMKFSGVDFSQFQKIFNPEKIPSQEVVNLAYKDLILRAFRPELPEKIMAPGPVDPLSQYNLAVGGKILMVSNQRFARAENLLSPRLPVFDPELYGSQGKIMDSWETVRHNPNSYDQLIFDLRQPSKINYIAVSTQYHLGNQAQSVQIEGFCRQEQKWYLLVPKMELDGHSLKRVSSEETSVPMDRIKVSLFPDGGLTRLGLYSEALPASEKPLYAPSHQAKSFPFKQAIGHSQRPLTPRYQASPERIAKNWKNLKPGQEVDLASLAYGGRIVSASNEHYGPAAQIISPIPPVNMFDGFESARSRIPNHHEEIVVALGRAAPIHCIEVDFTYFKNNNPKALCLFGLAKGQWISLVDRTEVKAFAGNKIQFLVDRQDNFEQVQVVLFPDGGLNRLRVLSRI